MTTAIAPKEATQLTIWEAPDGGWEDDGNTDIAPRFPMISLSQPTSKEGVAGKFYHSDTEESTDELDVVILVKRETRALFPSGSSELLCRSDDGHAPAPGQPLWDGRDRVDLGGKFGTVAVQSYTPSQCNLCPFARWGDNNEPPACGNSYVLLVDRGENDLAQFRISGTSIKPYRDFVASKIVPKNKRIFWFRVKVTAVAKTGDIGKWYVPAFTGTPLTEEEAKRYNDILRAQKARFEETVRSQGGAVEGWEDDEPDSAFTAELRELLDIEGLTWNDLAAFLPGVKPTEANLQGYMKRANLPDVTDLVAAVKDKTVPF